MSQTNNKIHPHKFMMWIAMGSICMMFAGLTSAYIVKSNQDNFLSFSLPPVFWYSTFTIVISSLTIQLALRFFQAREMKKYRTFLGITSILAILFILFQITGFKYLHKNGILLLGSRSNPSASFLLVIVGLHALHVFGGVAAVITIYIKSYFGRTRNYSSIPMEVMSLYWHFVGVLWLYLLLFFLWIK